jgi:FtsP/CotA-like multicopper oxidase with cupredoxin domain
MSGAVVTAQGSVPVWGFSGPAGRFNGDRDNPGPVIELTQGQPAAITLFNMSMRPHTIHPHGLDVDTANDGVPTTSPPVPMMGSFTYRFLAPHAGTYLYHCHVDASLHFEMGMYGAVIVRPPSGATNVVWDGGPSFAKEYIWQLGTFDTRWHSVTETGPTTRRYMPNVFMINGRDGAALLSDSTVAVSGVQGTRVLLRLISYAYAPAIVELGGLTFDIVASDGRPLRQAMTNQARLRIMPGERYDLIITLPSAGVRQATVSYQNIRGTTILGSAQTSVTST